MKEFVFLTILTLLPLYFYGDYKEMTKTVQNLKDKQEINDIIFEWRIAADAHTNSRGTDKLLENTMNANWLPDAVWEFNINPPITNRQDIIDAWSPGGSIYEVFLFQRTSHQSVIITINTDRTEAIARGTLISFETIKLENITTHEYIVGETSYQFVNTVDGWKIKKVIFLFDFFHTEGEGGYPLYPQDIVLK